MIQRYEFKNGNIKPMKKTTEKLRTNRKDIKGATTIRGFYE